MRREAGVADSSRPLNLIDIKILGQLQVDRGGAPVRLTPIVARALLILLAERGQAVSKALFQERLYGREPDKQTDQNVRRTVKELRVAFGGGMTLIPAVRHPDGFGYAISMDQVMMDADQYRQAVAAGTAALAARRCAEAVALFEAAEQLWRGEPLPELPDRDFTLEWRNELGRWRRVRTSGYAEALLRTGRHDEAIAHLHAPFTCPACQVDAGLHTLRIIALYLAWREHEAADACREAIIAMLEHGLEPDWLTWLQEQVLWHKLPRDGARALDAVRSASGSRT
jgi:DNA-binding SARP family transcriptional activator